MSKRCEWQERRVILGNTAIVSRFPSNIIDLCLFWWLFAVWWSPAGGHSLPFFISTAPLPGVLSPAVQTMSPFFLLLPFTHGFYAQANRGLSRDTDPAFLFGLFCSGKSVVSEPEDEVQTAEVGGGGLGVSAEEEGIASHKPVETGDETGEPGGNRCHVGRLKDYVRVWAKEDMDKGRHVETVRG